MKYSLLFREVWLNREIAPSQWTTSSTKNISPNTHFTYWKLCGEMEPYYCSNREPTARLDAHDHNLNRYRNQIMTPPATFFSSASTERLFSWVMANDMSCPSTPQEVPFKLPRESTKEIMHNFIYEEPLESTATPRSKHTFMRFSTSNLSKTGGTTPQSKFLRTNGTPGLIKNKVTPRSIEQTETSRPPQSEWTITDENSPNFEGTTPKSKSMTRSTISQNFGWTDWTTRSANPGSTNDIIKPATSEENAAWSTASGGRWTVNNENTEGTTPRSQSTRRSTISRNTFKATPWLGSTARSSISDFVVEPSDDHPVEQTESGRTSADSLIDKTNPLMENDEKYFNNHDTKMDDPLVEEEKYIGNFDKPKALDEENSDVCITCSPEETSLPGAVNRVLSAYDEQPSAPPSRIVQPLTPQPSHNIDEQLTSNINTPPHQLKQPTRKQYTATIAVKDTNTRPHATRDVATISVSTDNAPPDRMEIGVPGSASVSMVDNLRGPSLHTAPYTDVETHVGVPLQNDRPSETTNSFTTEPVDYRSQENIAQQVNPKVSKPIDFQTNEEIRVKNVAYPTNHVRLQTQHVNKVRPLPYPSRIANEARPLVNQNAPTVQQTVPVMRANENAGLGDETLAAITAEEASRLPHVSDVTSVQSTNHVLHAGQPTARKALAEGLNVFTFTTEELEKPLQQHEKTLQRYNQPSQGLQRPTLLYSTQNEFSKPPRIISAPLEPVKQEFNDPITSQPSRGARLRTDGVVGGPAAQFLATHPMVKTYLDRVDVQRHPAVENFLQHIVNEPSPSPQETNNNMRSEGVHRNSGEFLIMKNNYPQPDVGNTERPRVLALGSLKPSSRTPNIHTNVVYGMDDDVLTRHVPTNVVKITTSTHATVEGDSPTNAIVEGDSPTHAIVEGDSPNRPVHTAKPVRQVMRIAKGTEAGQMVNGGALGVSTEEEGTYRNGENAPLQKMKVMLNRGQQSPNIKNLFESTAVSWTKPAAALAVEESSPERRPPTEPLETPPFTITRQITTTKKMFSTPRRFMKNRVKYVYTTQPHDAPTYRSVHRNSTKEGSDCTTSQKLSGSLDSFVTSKRCNEKQTFNNILHLLGPSEQDFERANNQLSDPSIHQQFPSFIGSLFKRGTVANLTRTVGRSNETFAEGR